MNDRGPHFLWEIGDWQLGPRDQEIRSSEGSEGTEDFDVSRMC